MNIHPLFVHFPIGILVLYVGFEIMRIPWLVRQSWYFYIKAALSVLGTAAAYVTVYTGGLAEELIPRTADIRPVLAKHEMFAQTTAIIFSVLAAAYLFTWLKQEGVIDKLVIRLEWTRALVALLDKCARYVLRPYVAILLALAGLIAITITGALGASMVYGPDVDPFVTIIYKLFF